MKKSSVQQLPISQSALAAYLGVTSSQLSMNSSDRYGSRNLKATAAEKLAELMLIHHQQSAKKTGSRSFREIKNRLATECRRLAGSARAQAEYSHAYHTILKRKLDKMKEQHVAASAWIKTLGYLLETLPATKENAGDRGWRKTSSQN